MMPACFAFQSVYRTSNICDYNPASAASAKIRLLRKKKSVISTKLIFYECPGQRKFQLSCEINTVKTF